jgi:hypothetical protein
MKKLNRTLSVGLLSLALLGSAYAGDIQWPSAPSPAPLVPPTSQVILSDKNAPQQRTETSMIEKLLQNVAVVVLRLF